MEEPGTPNSATWWDLMGDDPNSPEAQKAPLSPKSFASLWTTPTPEETVGTFDDGNINNILDVDDANESFDTDFYHNERRSSRHVDRVVQPELERNLNVGLAEDYDDNASYLEEGSILDMLEDGMCTLDIKSPSMAEIEKRIEQSWKEIETRTAQFFGTSRSRRRSKKKASNQDETEASCMYVGKELKARSTKKKHDRRQDANTHQKYSTRATRNTPRNDSDRDKDSRYLYREGTTSGGRETGNYRRQRKRGDVDRNEDTESRETMSGSILKRVTEARENPATVLGNNMKHMPRTQSTEHNASMNMTGIPTLTRNPVQSLQSYGKTQSSLKSKSRHHRIRTPTNMSLTIFEPTNASILLNQRTTKKNEIQQRDPPTTSPAIDAAGLYIPGTEVDPNVQRRCFSPNLGKTQPPFGILNSLSTASSTVQSVRSQSSVDEVTGNHDHTTLQNAYVAFVERGKEAKESMRLYEQQVPSAFPRTSQEIVVRVSYSTISHTDCAVRRGDYWDGNSDNPVILPIIPGVAFSGYITQLDRAAMRGGLRYLDRVISLVRVGANARHICIMRDQVVTVPDELKDDKKVACLPEIYLGAFQALHLGQKNGARYRKTSLSGKSILILGGATILGKALIELCHSAGAHAIYGTGKERHFPIIEASRATPVSRDPCHWYSLLKGRVDLVVGLDNDSFKHSEASAQHLEVLSSKGRAVLFGAPECSCDAKIDDKKRIYVYNVHDSWEKDLKQCKRDLSHLCKLMMEGSIDPQILETLSLNHIADVHDTVENRDFSSFLLCDPWKQDKPEKIEALSPPGILRTKTRSRRKRHSSRKDSTAKKQQDPLPGGRPTQRPLAKT